MIVFNESLVEFLKLVLIFDDFCYDEIYLSNYVSINVEVVLKCVLGVGWVCNIGLCFYVMWVWLKFDILVGYELIVNDVSVVIKV